MSGFDRIGFPHCVGAIDGTHIPLIGPAKEAAEYCNRKCTYSVLLQGLMDHTGQFLDIEVGWSGKNHDAHVFHNSILCEAMDSKLFIPGHPTIDIGGVTVPPIIVGDGAYPLRSWLMKSYGGLSDPRRIAFDRRLARARNVVECAFGRLKGRWRCLSSRLCLSFQNVVPVVSSCAILHNVCEGIALDGGGVNATRVLDLPDPVAPYSAAEELLAKQGVAVRDVLADVFYAMD